jgi:hypothetical protein
MSGHKCKIPNVCLSEKKVLNKIHIGSSPVTKKTQGEMLEKCLSSLQEND